MNIEEFYAANEQRRQSAEIEFGGEWTDVMGNEYELSWVEATGELYLMLGPEATVAEGLFGDAYRYNEPISGLLIKIIATLASHEQVEAALNGWADEMSQSNSLRWLTAKFPSADN